jgi:hypothetical protein
MTNNDLLKIDRELIYIKWELFTLIFLGIMIILGISAIAIGVLT